MVMVAEAAEPVAELTLPVREGVDHALLGEEPERAVDGREPQALAALPQPLVELLGGDVVVLVHQLREHSHALAGRPDADALEELDGARLPIARHGGMLALYMKTRIVLTLLGAVPLTLLTAGCGGGGAAGTSGRTQVVAGFYPLAFAAEEIGGNTVDVTNLTPAGAEPHDVELTPRDVERIRSADLVLYVGEGFQPALEEAAAGGTGTAVDVLEGIELREDDGSADPHVWLDPIRFAQVVERVGAELGGEAPARQLASQLRALDGEYREGLADCERRELVTAHDAFGYLGERFGLEVIPIAGLAPEAEPTPRDLEEIAGLVEERGVTTVFVETLLSPEIGETVAREAGVETSVLNPLEGLTEEELARGENYLSVMRANLEALRAGLGCR
jgi:zinc transport system substrate-binding protein